MFILYRKTIAGFSSKYTGFYPVKNARNLVFCLGPYVKFVWASQLCLVIYWTHHSCEKTAKYFVVSHIKIFVGYYKYLFGN